ncbi:metallophosphoesterase [Alistipes sp. An116]|uniref:calcineurin-like phosphoesterase C-terminal domain-containing protein n=1 Tax=Alistipes sp. An116 TaxID=1965546 RepID=UPI000B36D35A|nr:calcineurin-like phosphoesterase family protein [Alistipes sp. An116]OUQ54464.1 metallophosphoesterase [Alistipes sp. An116]
MKKLFILALFWTALSVHAQTPTIVGRVTCKGKPVAGVVLSDGEQVVRTDTDGRYEMCSSKPCGYVFMSIPGGYEVVSDGLIPRFFGYTTHCSTDVIDFQLKKRHNNNFTLFVSADTHLRGDPQEHDLPQFRKWYLSDISHEIESTKGPVYSLLLGDMTTDIMWHKNDFALRKYLDVMKTYPSSIFHIPGNHDNERFIHSSIPDAQWDSIAQRPYRQIIGPNYYSFNLGKVHFVMLDNIIVRKGELRNNKRPSRNDYQLDERQLRWLSRDLETIDNNTPLVVCMHVPIADWTGISDKGIPTFSASENQQVLYTQIMPLLTRFENVRLLAGHSHRFINIPLTNRIFQHTLVSVSAVSWKINGPESRLISEDGSPGGYLILHYRGDRACWQFKPNGYRADCNQFRVYDLNRVPEEFGGQPGSNRILINVYNWDEQWTVRVREKGRDLTVEQIWAKDPLYILIRRDALPTRPTAFRAVANPHMFSVKTSSPNTSLEVIVTDRFGRKYRQMINRPKDFDWQIE